jgi:hypothetical protein
MYQDLQEMERRLDWTMTRKKVEVQDALGRSMTVCTVLRSMSTMVRLASILYGIRRRRER